MKNYYAILDVPRTASDSTIKQAYRRLIKQCHPDRNHNAGAAEWTRALNEAYQVLSNEQSRAEYDRDLRAEEANHDHHATTTGSGASSESTSSPEPAFCCETCGRLDASLRVSATWRVTSFINYSRKSPTVKLQCNRCRVKESLFASLWTGLLGWWSIYGLFWTLEALVKNACGGEQPKPNNAALLKAISYQLYQQGRLREAHEALLAGLKLEPDPNAAPTMEFFRREVGLPQKKPFWQRFRALELYPAFYHAPVALAALGLMIYLLCGTDGTQASPQASPTTYVSGTSAAPVAPAPAQHPSVQFLEPEIPLPEVGLLIPGTRMALPLSCTAPLTIKTRASDGNYVVKVVDWYTGEFVGMFFIRSGHTLSSALPLGTYKLKFACGQKWYGPNYLFGPETLYSYADERLTFYLSANYREGHSIELIPQVGGNLRTKQLSSVDW